MLLYLVKYSRPDIANAVRELSKGMKEVSGQICIIYKEFGFENATKMQRISGMWSFTVTQTGVAIQRRLEEAYVL